MTADPTAAAPAGELLSCPFCGSAGIDAEGWKAMSMDGASTRAGPACDVCGSSAESAAAWNRRAASLALSPVQAPAASQVAVKPTLTISREDAALVAGAFLPLNPNRLRNATPEVKRAACAFKDAVANSFKPTCATPAASQVAGAGEAGLREALEFIKYQARYRAERAAQEPNDAFQRGMAAGSKSLGEHAEAALSAAPVEAPGGGVREALEQAVKELGGPTDGDWSSVHDDDYVELRVRGGLLKQMNAALASVVVGQPENGDRLRWERMGIPMPVHPAEQPSAAAPPPAAAGLTAEPTDAQVKDAAREFAAHEGLNPDWVFHNTGEARWERLAPSMRKALIAAARRSAAGGEAGEPAGRVEGA